MCGITGFVSYDNDSIDASTILKMTKVLSHRGPDGLEIWEKKNNESMVALGHTRLSIIDLSTAATQPMHYQDLTITFNGEIYNYKQIKNELIALNHQFQTQSDTEVILHAFKQWGTKAVNKFHGMFAFCIYDDTEKKIYLYRDRLGVKPLYYSLIPNKYFLFASELKSFHEFPFFKKQIDKSSLLDYLKYDYTLEPYSIFENVFKLMPGQFLEYNIASKEYKLTTYWDALDYYKENVWDMSFSEAKEELEKILRQSFELRMVSDVPVGVFLSGGYDSSLIAGMLQKNRIEKLKTFTISFDHPKYDESAHAKKVAEYLGTDHYEYPCHIEQARDIIPNLPYYYDEPLADSSVIPSVLLSKMARQDVKVALSGDGGDELFYGYTRHHKIHKYNKIMSTLGPLSILPNAFSPLPHLMEKRKYRNKMFELRYPQKNITIKYLDYILQKYREPFLASMFLQTVPHRDNNYTRDLYQGINDFHKILAVDLTTYLPNDILVKVDRASMANSLEAREPFLDQNIVEFAARLPLNYLYDEKTKTKKYILREICHDYIPKEIMDRPKQGFNPSMKEWLTGDLKPMIYDLLSPDTLQTQGIFNKNIVSYYLDKFMKGDDHFQPLVWNLTLFQLWYERWMR